MAVDMDITEWAWSLLPPEIVQKHRCRPVADVGEPALPEVEEFPFPDHDDDVVDSLLLYKCTEPVTPMVPACIKWDPAFETPALTKAPVDASLKVVQETPFASTTIKEAASPKKEETVPSQAMLMSPLLMEQWSSLNLPSSSSSSSATSAHPAQPLLAVKQEAPVVCPESVQHVTVPSSIVPAKRKSDPKTPVPHQTVLRRRQGLSSKGNYRTLPPLQTLLMTPDSLPNHHQKAVAQVNHPPKPLVDHTNTPLQYKKPFPKLDASRDPPQEHAVPLVPDSLQKKATSPPFDHLLRTPISPQRNKSITASGAIEKPSKFTIPPEWLTAESDAVAGAPRKEVVVDEFGQGDEDDEAFYHLLSLDHDSGATQRPAVPPPIREEHALPVMGGFSSGNGQKLAPSKAARLKAKSLLGKIGDDDVAALIQPVDEPPLRKDVNSVTEKAQAPLCLEKDKAKVASGFSTASNEKPIFLSEKSLQAASLFTREVMQECTEAVV